MKMIFIHVPKCGGFETGKILHKNGVLYDGHKTAAQYKAEAVQGEMFALVRNPYDRLISAYYYLIEGGQQNKRDLFYQALLLKYDSFKDFIFNIGIDGLIDKIQHIKPITYFTCDENNIPLVKWFKLEQIETFKQFLKDSGINIELKKNNTSVHLPAHSYLDNGIRQQILKYYQKDFSLFNYNI